jgi:hypothetical protein
MSKQRVCDRCGKVIKRSLMDILKDFFDVDYKVPRENIDLCQNCEIEFRAWLNGGKR